MKCRIYFLLVLSIVYFNVQAQAPAAAEKIPFNPKVKSGQLPNGLKYFILQNKKPENKVELRLAVNAGSILEADDQQGLAHFMEHMNFNGLKHFPHNDIVHYLQSVGVKFGADLNAYTSFEETVYMLPIPTTDKAVVDKGFTILADWSQDALLDHDEIDKERGVVLEESRLGKGADDRMMKKYLPVMLNGSIYARRIPIGTDEVLKNFKYEVIKRFHHDWYRPNNEAVVVVGDIDPAEAERLIKEKFSGFKNPSPERPRGSVIDMPARKQSQAMVVTDKEANYTFIQIIGKSTKSKVETTTADYRENIVQNLFNSMLAHRFEELKNSATPPFIFGGGGINGGWVRGWESFGAVAVCGTKQVKNAVDALVTETMKAKKFGFTAAELERAKAETVSQYESMNAEKDKTESGQLVDELVRHFLSKECVPGIGWEYEFTIKSLPGIRLEEVNAVAKKIDIDNNFFALITAKEDPALPKDAELLDWVNTAVKAPVAAYAETKLAASLLSKQPTAGTITKEESNTKIGTTTYTLSNGAIVTIRPSDFKNDEVLMSSLRMGGASLYEGADYQSATFSNNVVEEMGYGDFSNTDLEKFLSGKKASVQTIVDDYTEHVSGNCSVKDLETMFQLIYLKCTAPRKDETAFKSFVSREKQQLELMMQSPEFAFAENTYVDLYQHHPRAHINAVPADFDAINIDHAIDYYKQRLGSMNGMHFYIAGNIKADEIKSLLEKYIASLPGGPINTSYKDIKMIAKPGINTFTFKKGKEKKAMLQHYIFNDAKFDVDDNFYLNFLNEVINNKIVDTIREAMAAIYGGGIGGSIQKIPAEKYMLVSRFPCVHENVDKVDKAFWQIIESVKKSGGITDGDVEKARKPLVEKNKVRIKTNNYWIGIMQDGDKNGYSAERVLTYDERINAITPAKLMEIANKYYKRDNVYTAIMLPEN
ncbi:MAG: insulinase family protein [Ferruginibacter sp.]